MVREPAESLILETLDFSKSMIMTDFSSDL